MGFIRSAVKSLREKATAPAAAAPVQTATVAPHGGDVVEAHRLVCEAVQDMEMAFTLLSQPRGVIGAAKQAGGAVMGQEDATMKGAGQALVHDGRLDAKKLVETAFEKYDAATDLIEGLPELVPPEVKPGKIAETGDAIAGKAGSGTANAMVSGAFLALNLASGATAGIGFIRPAVKRRRMKKAVGSVEAALQEMRNARDWLAAQPRP